MDNESLIEKAKRLLNQRRAVIRKQYEENHKRIKTTEDCEPRESSEKPKINVPDSLKPNNIKSSETTDTIRDIFNEIIENMIINT